jgi:hypothetical protein
MRHFREKAVQQDLESEQPCRCGAASIARRPPAGDLNNAEDCDHDSPALPERVIRGNTNLLDECSGHNRGASQVAGSSRSYLLERA